MSRKLTLLEFEEKLRLRHPNLKVLGEYKGSHIKLETMCTTCGYTWECLPSNLYALVPGTGCPKCSRIKDGERKRRNIKDLIELFNEVHNNFYDYSKVNYLRSGDKICIICPIHGEFWQSSENHYAGHGCPSCNKSKGELTILKYLDSLNIEYIGLYRIETPELENQSFALIDFFLPKYNLFIEYNGELHYRPIKHFGGVLKLLKQINRDNYVLLYCLNNNIVLLEIPYNTCKDSIINLINMYL